MPVYSLHGSGPGDFSLHGPGDFTLHGFGDVAQAPPPMGVMIDQAFTVRTLARLPEIFAMARSMDTAPTPPSQLVPTPAPTTAVGQAGGFLEQWGIPIAAGLGGFVAGLAIAKFARGRK